MGRSDRPSSRLAVAGATAAGHEGEEEEAAVAALGESYRAIQLLRGKVSDSMGPLLRCARPPACLTPVSGRAAGEGSVAVHPAADPRGCLVACLHVRHMAPA